MTGALSWSLGLVGYPVFPTLCVYFLSRSMGLTGAERPPPPHTRAALFSFLHRCCQAEGGVAGLWEVACPSVPACYLFLENLLSAA